MTIGIVKNNLMVRILSLSYEMELLEKFVLPVNFTSKTMKNFVFVEPHGCGIDEALEKWVLHGLNQAKTKL